MTSLLEPTLEEWAEVPYLAIAEYEAKKATYSPTLRGVGEVLQMLPNDTTGVPSYPAPLTSMLAGGMLGAGAGYGIGALGEKLLPNSFHKGRLRKTLATMGGLAGTVPGALWAYGSKSLLPAAIKQALWDGTGAVSGPLINVDEFNQVIWSDPRVSKYVPLPVRAAASGLLLGASHLADNGMVSPMDVGRIAAGMGSGYVSGALVGKTLGLLIGLPQEQQDRLKNTGMYAGIISTMIPRLFQGQ